MTTGLSARTVKLDEAPDLLALIPHHSGLAWLTDATSLVASGPFWTIDPGTGPGRFQRGAAQVEEFWSGAAIHDEVDVPGSGPVVFGSWTFDEQVPGSLLRIPSTIYGCGEGAAWKTTLTFERARIPPVAESGRSPRPGAGEQQWMELVRQALLEIRSGRLDKVVLARKVEVTAAAAAGFDQRRLVQALAQEYPGCFTFSFDNLVGASPELLVRRLGDVVDSVPLAGSTKRGGTAEEDRELGRQLQESLKNRLEHDLAVATVMDRLAPWCIRLIREPEPSLLLLANLQHLSTKIQGRLRGAPSALELAGALHPTAAVCGVPPDQALALIRHLETFSRGRYAGPVGWMDHRGDGEWALALRCAQIRGQRAEVFAGAGVVAQSDPASELEETRLKLSAILPALEAAGSGVVTASSP